MKESIRLTNSGEAMAYDLFVSAYTYKDMCISIHTDQNPCLSLYPFKFDFIRMVNAYMHFAYNPRFIKDNPEALEAFYKTREAYFIGAEKTFPAVVNSYSDYCIAYGEAYEKTNNNVHLASIADEIAGAAWIYVNGLVKLLQALEYPGFTESLPDDAIIPAKSVPEMGRPIYQAINAYRDSFHSLTAEAQEKVALYFGDRYSALYFPYNVGSNEISKEWGRFSND